MEKIVLIVDDNDTLRYMLRQMLEIVNLCVIEAKNGYAALALSNDLHPDLIVCDINMPEMNGFEVLQTLRQGSYTEDIPVIMISSHLGNQYQEVALELGANAYLAKPFTFKALLTVVAKQFNWKSVELV
jgi:CheY-like chemotaxis protein